MNDGLSRKRRQRNAARDKAKGVLLSTDGIMALYGNKRRAHSKNVREALSKGQKPPMPPWVAREMTS